MKQTDAAVGLDRRYDTSYLAVQIRLDTTSLLERIEVFLRGGKIVHLYNKDDELVSTKIENGVPKCNDQGIQTLLNWISGTVNSQVVQGNFSIDKKTNVSKPYDDYIKEYNIELATLVILNIYDWKMEESDAEGVINFIMLLIIPFMTRLIDNKERESYSDTIKTIENSRYETGNKLFGLGGASR